MARKKFEEVEYDPIEAEANRNLARQVSQAGIPTPMTIAVGNTVAKEAPINTDEPAPTTKEAVKEFAFVAPKKEALARPERKQKKRSFSCATSDQDSELDGFMLRIEEAARTHVPFQVMMRAACMAMMGAEEQIMTEMRKNPPPSCPATFAHAQYAQFEEYWTEVMGKALRKSRPS
jgi:hypothetical protein